MLKPNQQVVLPQLDVARTNSLNNIHIRNTPDQTIISNPNGLVNVTCDLLQYSAGWASGFTGSADHGSYTVTPGSKVFLKFNGTRVHVFAHMEWNSCYAKIFIDSREVDKVSFQSNPNRHAVAFSSDELQYGEHLIEVQHDGNEGQSLVIVSFVYDPLPKYDRKILGFDSLEQSNEQWKQDLSNQAVFQLMKTEQLHF